MCDISKASERIHIQRRWISSRGNRGGGLASRESRTLGDDSHLPRKPPIAVCRTGARLTRAIIFRNGAASCGDLCLVAEPQKQARFFRPKGGNKVRGTKYLIERKGGGVTQNPTLAAGNVGNAHPRGKVTICGNGGRRGKSKIQITTEKCEAD